MTRSRKPIHGSQLHDTQTRQLTPAKPMRNRQIGGELPPDSRDPSYLYESGVDAMYDRDIMPYRRDWKAGMPLADFECGHGSLPSDTKINCDCWR